MGTRSADVEVLGHSAFPKRTEVRRKGKEWGIDGNPGSVTNTELQVPNVQGLCKSRSMNRSPRPQRGHS